MTTFAMTAHHLSTYSDASNAVKVQDVRFSAEAATPAEAEAIAATFPKGCKVAGGSCYVVSTGETVGHVSLTIKLESNGVNGGVNETGLRRMRSFLKAAEKLGHEVTYTPGRATNAFATREDFEALI